MIKLELTEEDLQMLENELKYSRCLYWDGKLKTNDNYCDGNCYECNKK